MWTATTAAQVDAWQGVLDTCEQLGEPVFRRLSPAEVQRRTGSSAHLAGIFDPATATVQPAALVRGLRRVAKSRGVCIYENTPVTAFDRNSPARLITPGGQVTAARVVIANNAWAGEIAELRRLIVPVASTVVVTEPIPERLQALGWRQGEAVTDSQLLVDYYRTTRDGRIVFGKGTGVVGFGARIEPRFDFSTADARLTEADFRRVYPMLADVPIAHRWSGPIDRTYDSLPLFGALPGAEHMVYGIGWSGNGVGPSYVGARILASLALGLKNEWSQCALVGRYARSFPPEPLRFIGGRLVRAAVLRKEKAEARGARPRQLDSWLTRLAPAGLEDKPA